MLPVRRSRRKHSKKQSIFAASISNEFTSLSENVNQNSNNESSLIDETDEEETMTVDIGSFLKENPLLARAAFESTSEINFASVQSHSQFLVSDCKVDPAESTSTEVTDILFTAHANEDSSIGNIVSDGNIIQSSADSLNFIHKVEENCFNPEKILTHVIVGEPVQNATLNSEKTQLSLILNVKDDSSGESSSILETENISLNSMKNSRSKKNKNKYEHLRDHSYIALDSKQNKNNAKTRSIKKVAFDLTKYLLENMIDDPIEKSCTGNNFEDVMPSNDLPADANENVISGIRHYYKDDLKTKVKFPDYSIYIEKEIVVDEYPVIEEKDFNENNFEDVMPYPVIEEKDFNENNFEDVMPSNDLQTDANQNVKNDVISHYYQQDLKTKISFPDYATYVDQEITVLTDETLAIHRNLGAI